MDTLNRNATRKSLPLSARDIADLNKLRGSQLHRAALSSMATEVVTENSSDAAFLHAVMEAGIRAVTEQVEEEGYARIAAEQKSTAAARQAIARRRRPSWADE